MPSDTTEAQTIGPQKSSQVGPKNSPVSDDKEQPAPPEEVRASTRRKQPNGKKAGRQRATSDNDIDTPASLTPLVLAIAFLIAMMLIAFLGVALINEIVTPTATTFFLIQLIFALLCGAAGAMVGGSAVVRSALRIPGNPVTGRVSGGAAMIVVGFLLAYVGSPDEQMPMYSLDIHSVPRKHEFNGQTYQIRVEAYDPLKKEERLQGRNDQRITMKIPALNDHYQAAIQIYKESGRDLQFVWGCELTFETLERPRTDKLTDLLAQLEHPHFHLYFTESYIDRVVEAASKKKTILGKNACLEGALMNGGKAGFDGNFLVRPQKFYDRFGRGAGIWLGPSHRIRAIEFAAPQPNEVEADVSPTEATKAPSPNNPPPSASGDVANHAPISHSSSAPSGNGTSASASPPAAHTAIVHSEVAPTASPHAIPASSTTSGAPSSQTIPPQLKPEPIVPPPEVTTQSGARELQTLVDRYVRGEEFDRKRLYESWDGVQDYVVEGFRKEHAKRTPFAARYLHLISNALNEIDGHKFVPPLRNPALGGKIKPERLHASNHVPGFDDADYARVVDFLDDPDENLRKAAQRLVRLFPSNRFYKPIQDYLKKAAITNEQLSWMAEAAAFYFYNRIAEFQGSFALEDSGRKWIEGNYENGKAWVEKAAARDPDHRILGAMLDYARASVLWDWDRKEKDANEYYKRMLETIRSLDASYPLNPHHVAAALAVTNGYPVSRVPDTTRPYAPDDRRKLTGTAYETDKKKQITLFALPDDTSKKVADIASELKGRMILRTDNWDLVQVAKNLGWAERKPVTTAGRRQ